MQLTVTYEVPDTIDAKELADVVTDSLCFDFSYSCFRLNIDNDEHISIPVSYHWGEGTTMHGMGAGSLELCNTHPDDCEHE